MKSKEEWDKPFEDPTESSKENLTEIEQLAEAIRIKHIPNGCINLAPHIRGKKAYKIEKQTIRSAMIEFGKAYADQFKGENEAIVKHQDEIIGRLTRQNEYLVDTEEKRQEWLSKAKNDAGFDLNNSFNDVWAIVLSVYLQSLKSK